MRTRLRLLIVVSSSLFAVVSGMLPGIWLGQPGGAVHWRPAAGVAHAESLWSESGLFSGSLYGDIKARQVGDIVTIIIYEDARASNNTSKTTGKAVEAGLGGGTGALGFVPSAGLELGSQLKNTETNSQSGSLRATMTARITEVLENGTLRIEGSRKVTVNGEQQELVVTGLIRAKDITKDNTIESNLVADAEIWFKGSPEVRESGGLLSRLWNSLMGVVNWIF